MDTKTKIGLELLGVSFVLGFIGDLLLRVGPWGLNAAVWTLLLVTTGYFLVKRWQPSVTPVARILLIPLMMPTLAFVWRDAGLLKFANAVTLMVLLVFCIHRVRIWSMRKEHPFPDEPRLFRTGWNALFKWPAFLVREVDWKLVAADGRGPLTRSTLRGLFMVGPFLFIFGVLLVEADAMFEATVQSVLNLNLSEWPLHLMGTFFISWAIGGFLLGVLVQPEGESDSEDVPGRRRLPRLRIGAVEAGVILGLINLLFAVFVFIQLPYLFGGSKLLSLTNAPSPAEYARRGFFELVTVASIALPLLLGLSRRSHGYQSKSRNLIRGLIVVQSGLLMIILTSAALRMWIYQGMYGLTELRLYTSVFMGWVGCVLIWFMMTVLKDQVERFIPGAVATGFVFVMLLNVMNPDAVIVRTNVARAIEGKPFDPYYLTRLSDDAVPTLLKVLPSLGPTHQQDIAYGLRERMRWDRGSDWRVWNRSRAHTRTLLIEQSEALSKLAMGSAQPGIDKPEQPLNPPTATLD